MLPPKLLLLLCSFSVTWPEAITQYRKSLSADEIDYGLKDGSRRAFGNLMRDGDPVIALYRRSKNNGNSNAKNNSDVETSEGKGKNKESKKKGLDKPLELTDYKYPIAEGDEYYIKEVTEPNEKANDKDKWYVDDDFLRAPTKESSQNAKPWRQQEMGEKEAKGMKKEDICANYVKGMPDFLKIEECRDGPRVTPKQYRRAFKRDEESHTNVNQNSMIVDYGQKLSPQLLLPVKNTEEDKDGQLVSHYIQAFEKIRKALSDLLVHSPPSVQ